MNGSLKRVKAFQSKEKLSKKQVVGKRKIERETVMKQVDQFVKVDKIPFKTIVQRLVEMEEEGSHAIIGFCQHES